VEDQRPVPAGIDVSTPNVARVWDYQLGGKDNYAADRAAAEAVNEALRRANAPTGQDAAQENRAFIRRVVRFFAEEAGIRQFVDIGAGLPTQGNVHEIAQRVTPDARVVYVDYDPVVVVHGRALLAGDDNVHIVQADMRQPEGILQHPELRSRIDLGQPVAVLLIAVLHLLTAEDNPAEMVARVIGALPPGSYLAITHATREEHAQAADVLAEEFARLRITTPILPRTRAEIAQFFTGLELVRPGLVFASDWRPDPAGTVGGRGAHWLLAGVGRTGKA
jgi:O-methyltransferase involved in polyketide biosynthesis